MVQKSLEGFGTPDVMLNLPRDVMTENRWQTWGYKIAWEERHTPFAYTKINNCIYPVYSWWQIDIINTPSGYRRRKSYEDWYHGEIDALSA